MNEAAGGPAAGGGETEHGQIGDHGAALAVGAALPAPAAAQSGEGLRTVFECALRNGKIVSVTSQGGNLFYEYGRPNRPELSLRGSPRSGDVAVMRGDRRVADHSCRRYTDFQNSFDLLNSSPADSEAYSAM